MTKKEFLNKIEQELISFDKDEVNEIIRFYDEIISDKMDNDISEIDAVNSLGSIQKIIKEIKMNIVLKRSEIKNTNSLKNFLIILGICSTPILIPLAIAFFVVYFALFIVLLSVVLAFGASGFAVLIACIFEGTRSIFSSTEIGIILIQYGIGLLVGSVLILGAIKLLAVTKVFLNKTNNTFIKSIKKLTKKEEISHV